MPTTGILRTHRPMLGAAPLLLALCAFSACSSAEPSEMTAEQQEALSDTLLLQAENLDRAWSGGDVQAFLDLFTEDSYYYWRGLGMPPSVFGDVFTTEMEGAGGGRTEMINPQVRVLGPNSGMVSFEFRATSTGSAGQTLEDAAKAVTFVFRKVDDEWKVVLAHESGPPPPMQ